MPIPTDSLMSQAERRARMAAEAAERAEQRRQAEQQRLERERAENEVAQRQEDDFIHNISIISEAETREALYKRVREAREQRPEPPKTMPLTERMRQQIEAEQEAGRQAVARHQAERDALQEARLKAQREDAERQATTAPVYHPNPTMDERFPVVKATIK